MGKAKLARPVECSQIVSLAPTRSFNMMDTYSTVKIMKRSFLVGQKLCLIWRFLVGQWEYIVRRFTDLVSTSLEIYILLFVRKKNGPQAFGDLLLNYYLYTSNAQLDDDPINVNPYEWE